MVGTRPVILMLWPSHPWRFDLPTRYLKPGIRDSELIDGLSPMAEVMFYRLLVTVDDFGRFDARPSMLKSQCFPIKDKITPKNCQEYLQELVEAGLVLAYMAEGKPFLQVLRWDNVPRSKESKYPEYSDSCAQMYTSANGSPTVLPVTVTVTETQTEGRSPKGSGEFVGFASFWDAWPASERKQAKGKCLEAWKKAGAEKEAAQIVAHVERMKSGEDWKKNGGAYIPAPLVYLNQRRWEGAVEAVSQSIFAGAI